MYGTLEKKARTICIFFSNNLSWKATLPLHRMCVTIVLYFKRLYAIYH